MFFLRFAIFSLMLVTFPACKRTPGSETHQRVTAMIRAGQTEEARHFVKIGLEKNPSDIGLLNDQVVLLLLEEDRQSRRAVLATLETLDSLGAGHGILFEQTSHASKSVRRNVARLLGQLNDPKSHKYLHTLAEDGDPEVRTLAVCALGKLKDPRSKMLLCIRLKDSEWKVRSEAADALAALGDSSATTYLLQRADDPDAYARMKIQNAVLHLANPALKKTYESLLESDSENKRVIAAQALAKIGETESSLPVLFQILRDSSTVDRAALATTLAGILPDSAFAKMEKTVQVEKNSAVREALLGYFARRPDEKSQAVVLKYLSSVAQETGN